MWKCWSRCTAVLKLAYELMVDTDVSTILALEIHWEGRTLSNGKSSTADIRPGPRLHL